VARKETVKHAFAAVLNQDRDFETAITQGTRDVKRVHKSFSTVEQIIHQTLKDSS
jgi:hypothetical protein